MVFTRKRSIIFFIVMNLSIVTVALLYNLLFEEKMIGDCAFLSLFRFYCPGCGGSRSLHYLLRLDLINSFIYYPPILICSLIILDVDLRLIISAALGKDKVSSMKSRTFLIIPASILINFLVRNILLLVFRIDLLGNLI